MAEPAKKIATYADIEALPPHVTGEIIYGSLYTQPSPAPRHGAAQAALSVELGNPFQKGNGGPGGWTFIIVPELHIDGHVLVPDMAGWRRERMPTMPKTAYVEIAPDWICEILSDSTAARDRNEKRAVYGAIGVQFLWLLDPRVKVLECFSLVADNWLLSGTFSGDTMVRATPFDAIEFSLSDLWPLDDPASLE
jgi:Uma2 family endonuclease